MDVGSRLATFRDGSPSNVFEIVEVTGNYVILKELEKDGTWQRRDDRSTDLQLVELHGKQN